MIVVQQEAVRYASQQPSIISQCYIGVLVALKRFRGKNIFKLDSVAFVGLKGRR